MENIRAMEILSSQVMATAEMIRSSTDSSIAAINISAQLSKMEKKYIFALALSLEKWTLLDSLVKKMTYSDKTLGLACIRFGKETAGPIVKYILERKYLTAKQIAMAGVMSNSLHCIEYLYHNNLFDAEMAEDVVILAGKINKTWVVAWILKFTTLKLDPSLIWACYPVDIWEKKHVGIVYMTIKKWADSPQFEEIEQDDFMLERYLTVGTVAARDLFNAMQTVDQTLNPAAAAELHS
jgi:hypothetical protein